MESVIASIITGVLALLGVIITNAMSNKEIEHKLETAQAVTDTKLEQLTEEVRKHNTFGDRITKLETRLDMIERRAV